MINVTRSYLPNKEKYVSYLDKIYNNCWLTNNGPLVKELETRLKEYLGVKNIILVSNGTIALDLAYIALNIKGEAITTPFSFVATTSSLCMNGITPVFGDIDSETLNLSPQEIEKKITDKTQAIVPVHVFGNPCDVKAIDEIATKHNLSVIYDAAHAFGVKYQGESVLNFGTVSTLSFHATKLFHTIEGGAIITNDDKLAEHIRYLVNFGIKSEDSIPYVGTNAKMNEFEAAMGLCVLDDIELILSKRKEIYNRYVEAFTGIYKMQKLSSDSEPNYSYFPIIFDTEEEMFKIKEKLNNKDIFPRRYFYPSLNTLDYIKEFSPMEVSQNISKKILCLPIYPDLSAEEQELIIKTILSKG